MSSPDTAARAPRATYRLQLHAGFGFADAADIAEYLAQLGVSHVYCSPYLQAARGSRHGYDIVDFGRPNEELGGAAEHERFCQTLAALGLRQMMDIVPNHMSISHGENAWWWEVLENGPSSRYAAYFDVDWRSPEAKLRDTILLPILEDHYGRVLERHLFRLERRDGAFLLRYHDHSAPLSPRSADGILRLAAERTGSEELAFLADAFGKLPRATATDRRSVQIRHRDKEVLRRRLACMCEEQPPVAAAIDAVLTELAFDLDALAELLDRQNYRLAYWRTAGQELDYRRFFDVSTLASLRVEDDHVFDDTHALVLDWVARGWLDGLRVDHPDGLRDPAAYLSRLRVRAPQAWIVVEKILLPGERLPAPWPVAGTTGYEFMVLCDGVFVDPDGEAPLTECYRQFTGETSDYPALLREKKHLVLRELLAADVHRLAAIFSKICESHRRYRDYTRRELSAVLREVIACFPVYRTYARAERGELSDVDVQRIEQTIREAIASRPDLDADLFGFLRDILLLRHSGPDEHELVMRLQQLTGPAMAKGAEDTAFYCYNRLVSLNEVGGDPGRFGRSMDEFHAYCAEIQARWPAAMLTSSTHDTKRGEDVRARISLLAEIPDRWAVTVWEWSRRNAVHRREPGIDRNLEYLLYQTLVGAWPIDAERLTNYLQKAAREAKTHTSWTSPREDYEAAVEQLARALLSDDTFLSSLQGFLKPLIQPARVKSLGMTLVRLTAPGVPDVYQGSELWNLSLVDPDNRRPVDYPQRRKLLAELDGLSPEEIVARGEEGLPKLWLIRQALRLRRERPEAFDSRGSYKPLAADGREREQVVTFMRGDEAISVAPRWPLKLAGDWGDTALALPAGEWRNELTGDAFTGTVPLSDLLARFPVALLSRGKA